MAGDCAAGDVMTSEVIEDEKQFYSKAKTYWKQIPPTVDGMLGGYGHISNIDLNSSRKFLQRFLRVGRSDVLSRRGCGSGGAVRGASSTYHTAGSLLILLVAATKALKIWVVIGWDLWTVSFVSGPQVRSWPRTRDLVVWEQSLLGLRVCGLWVVTVLPSQLCAAQG